MTRRDRWELALWAGGILLLLGMCLLAGLGLPW